MLSLLPRDADALATTLVGLKPAVADPTVSERVTATSEEGTLAARFQVVERGFADEQEAIVTEDMGTGDDREDHDAFRRLRNLRSLPDAQGAVRAHLAHLG